MRSKIEINLWKSLFPSRAMRSFCKEAPPLIRINVHYFYRLASNLVPLQEIAADRKIMEFFSQLYQGEQELIFFLWNPLVPPGTSFARGHELYKAVTALTGDAFREELITYAEAARISNSLSAFEIVLAAEYELKDVFVVSKKGIYSTTELIERAEDLFPEPFQKRVPDFIKDIHEAGRCIAFELPTAAGFHIFRAVEAVAKQYVLKVRGTSITDKEKRFGLGGYVKILIDQKVDERVTNAVAQLTKLHRNPAIHPEDHLSLNEAMGILGLAQSCILAMIADMEKREPDPDVSLTKMLPDPAAQVFQEDIEFPEPIVLKNGEYELTKELGPGD